MSLFVCSAFAFAVNFVIVLLKPVNFAIEQRGGAKKKRKNFAIELRNSRRL
jgi:hypothetical protein